LPTAWWDDIITALSQFTLLLVIARNSSFKQASLSASAW
jgi:TolB-like protein